VLDLKYATDFSMVASASLSLGAPATETRTGKPRERELLTVEIACARLDEGANVSARDLRL
jgi:hypothetical protein